MTTPDDDAARQAASPETSGEVLAQIAYSRPDLRAVIASNPATYPGLLEWLGAYGDAGVAAALAARRAAPATAAPTAPFAAVTPGGPGAPATPGSPGAPGAPVRGPEPMVGGYGPGSGPVLMPYTGTMADLGARRSRKGLWIGISVAVVVLIGGGAAAAYGLIFSKLGGAKSPEAAVTRMLDAAESKDPIAMYGLLSPAEVGRLSLLTDSVTGSMSAATPDAADADLAKQVADAAATLTIKVDGVKTASEPVGDGIAKVSLSAGSVTIDADVDKLTDAIVALSSAQAKKSGLADAWDEDAVRAQIAASVADTFPISASADDLSVTGAKGDVEPFVMAVREGGAWYVSPLLTVGEYASVMGGTERGDYSSDKVAHFDSPEAAASGMVSALASYASSGQSADLVAALPLAERRFVALYGSLGQDALGTVDVKEASFTVREKKDGAAWLTIKRLAMTITTDGDSGSLEVKGLCATATGATAEQSFAGCLDDVPAAVELGAKDLALVAVKESSGWHVSAIATLVDMTSVVSTHLQTLLADGKLQDPQWLQDTFGPLESLVAGSSIAGSSLGEDLAASDQPSSYGDDPELDALYVACQGGDAAACDELYFSVSPGSDYDALADTCGGTSELGSGGVCASLRPDAEAASYRVGASAAAILDTWGARVR